VNALDGVACKDPFNPDGTKEFVNKSVDCTDGGKKPFLGCRKTYQLSEIKIIISQTFIHEQVS